MSSLSSERTRRRTAPPATRLTRTSTPARGSTELGLVGILTAGAGHAVTVQVTAAVLLYRAVTYLPPIPLGALACLIWRHAPALIGASSINASPHKPDPHAHRDDGTLQPPPQTPGGRLPPYVPPPSRRELDGSRTDR
jgi:hypothetical protein